MESWCLIDKLTGKVFKTILTKDKLIEYLKQNPDIERCVDCIECDDAPSITLE